MIIRRVMFLSILMPVPVFPTKDSPITTWKCSGDIDTVDKACSASVADCVCKKDVACKCQVKAVDDEGNDITYGLKGDLPTGISISAAGSISETFTIAKRYASILTLTDSFKATNDFPFTLEVWE